MISTTLSTCYDPIVELKWAFLVLASKTAPEDSPIHGFEDKELLRQFIPPSEHSDIIQKVCTCGYDSGKYHSVLCRRNRLIIRSKHKELCITVYVGDCPACGATYWGIV